MEPHVQPAWQEPLYNTHVVVRGWHVPSSMSSEDTPCEMLGVHAYPRGQSLPTNEQVLLETDDVSAGTQKGELTETAGMPKDHKMMTRTCCRNGCNIRMSAP